jgi:hypothetical protein
MSIFSEAVQRRLDEHPEKMRQRRETVEHPFGTIKARIGATFSQSVFTRPRPEVDIVDAVCTRE